MLSRIELEATVWCIAFEHLPICHVAVSMLPACKGGGAFFDVRNQFRSVCPSLPSSAHGVAARHVPLGYSIHMPCTEVI